MQNGQYDFTLSAYRDFLAAFSAGVFCTFLDFITNDFTNRFVLRHDVDLLPGNSLRFAKLQGDYGIRGTYYFRSVPESFNPGIITQIANLGHEIGYHYEDLSSAASKFKEDEYSNKDTYIEKLLECAIESFERNLEKMRQIVPIKTACMHGSPLSKWDSRLLWTKYDYRDFGLLGEPYFDIDFTQVAYYTDTGRRWDGDGVSRRDKIMDAETQAIAAAKFPRFHSTFDIINAANSGELPEQIMFTFHPQRWHDSWWPWTKELVGQNVKNVAKCGINVCNDRNLERSRSGR